MSRVEMLIDSVRRELLNYQWVVLLKDKPGRRYVPVYVGNMDGEVIRSLLQGKKAAAPSYFDLSSLGVPAPAPELQCVIIDRLENNIFYARVQYVQDNESYDCPSAKALAYAIKEGAPIYAEESVLSKASFKLND
ncbi:MAG: bifunctional nuclease family protein [Chloroflexi bacterium]|nr:bifunctional nuclease family protein [Chloroflexota bacterium]